MQSRFPSSAAAQRDPVVQRSVEFLERLFGDDFPGNFQVRFWNGDSWQHGTRIEFTLVLNHPGALRKLLSGSELDLGEAYIFDDVDIQGPIESCLRLADFLLTEAHHSLREGVILKAMILQLPRTGRPRVAHPSPKLRGSVHSVNRDREAIRYHYDQDPAFYSLFLDPEMLYSEGYFRNPEDTLEQAQLEKLDYLCRKLDLRPGEHLLDVGCGWGAMVIFAAEHYGVRSTGITLSEKQADVAVKRIRAKGLEDRCRVELCDYRNLETDRLFDKIVSIGMFEHVGRDFLPVYFKRLYDLLTPGGLVMNTGISSSALYTRKGPSFIDRYVFPDGDLVPIHTALQAAEMSGFEVRDVENLREHYARTLHHWVQRLEAHAQDAKRMAGETIYRIWRLYMAGSAYAFRTGRVHLFQTLLKKLAGSVNVDPHTREAWYLHS